MASPIRTLGIDCGGSGIKGSILDESGALVAERVRFPTPYPLPPETFVTLLTQLAEQVGPFDRATVGMPGMIRHGVVINTPHYPRMAGPHTEPSPELVQAWRGFEVQNALATVWDRPVKVMNDAEVQGAAVVNGRGLEVMFTLGTGLGNAIFDDGRLTPHLELSHAPVRKGATYDRWIGKKALKKVGPDKWSRRIARMVDDLYDVFWWDHLYIGGGNAKHLTVPLREDATVVPNLAGIIGAVRAWELPQG